MSELSNVLNHPTSSSMLDSVSIPLPQSPSSAEVREAQAWQSMVHARFGSISSLYVALRAKHPPAAAHSLRVAFWTSAWAHKHGLKEAQLQLFETLALLHEVGKIGIPDRVLQKPDKLLETEQAMMDMHTQIGTEILRAAGASRELLIGYAGIGTLYEASSNPNSHDIAPLSSRLVNIVDAFDSMTSKQVYRDSSTKEVALAEIIRMSGSQFDPKLARSFAELVLSNDRRIQSQVTERWMSRLEQHDFTRYFDLDHDRTKERVSSSLDHSLNETFYRHMMDHVQNGVVFIDSEFRILDWNSAAERLTGRHATLALHQYWTPKIAGLCDVEGYPLSDAACPFRSLMTSGVTGKQRLSIRTEDGKFVQVSIDVVPVVSDRGSLCGGAMIIEDVSETAELEKRIVHLRKKACQDQLTKVANRGELNRQLPEFLEYHQRTLEPASIVICDIDYFKKINDTFSHQAGDDALIAFAKLLKESCRETDFVARFGGEEFVILCGHCDLLEAKKLAEEIRCKLQRMPIPALRNQCMTASFGVSTVQPEDTAESVLGRADRGLLIAKENGRDRVVALGDNEAAPSRQEPVKRSWWRSFFGNRERSLRTELITNVPRAVTLEKLKGFVHEYKAVVHHVDLNHAILDLDCKHAPIPKLKEERLGRFRMTIEIADVELKVNGKAESVKVCTLLDVEIASLRSRDRRADAIRSQANRLKTALQGYLVANEMDDVIREDVIRKFKAEKESRY